MATQVLLPRALDANGDPVAGAEARFYQSGTTTPLTMYSDTGLSNALAVPLEADSSGAFVQVFYNGATDVKLQVTEPDSGPDLPGYPLDPAPVFGSAANNASDVNYTSQVNNPNNDVQAAIDYVSNAIGGRSSDVQTMLSQANNAGIRTSIGIDALRFTSTAQTITSAGSLVIAHGLAKAPVMVGAVLQCTTAEHNYSIGDKVAIPLGDMQANQGVSVKAGTTNLDVRFGSNPNVFNGIDATSGASVALTNGSWEILFWALI